jgi:hypothetical protein
MRCGTPPKAPLACRRIELDKRLKRDAKPLAVVEQRAMVVGNPPRTGIDIEALVEFAGLFEATELRKGIAAAQGPIAAPCPAVELQNLHAVAGLAQFQRGGHARKAGAEDQDGSATGIAVEPDRALVSAVASKP